MMTCPINNGPLKALSLNVEDILSFLQKNFVFIVFNCGSSKIQGCCIIFNLDTYAEDRTGQVIIIKGGRKSNL